VFFSITGANTSVQLAHTDAAGGARFTYTGAFSGSDSISATTATGSTSLISNPANVTWSPGRDVTYLSLNLSPQSGTTQQPVNVVASLSDVTQDPFSPVSGASVSFTLGTSTCTAVSDSNGIALCQLNLPPPGGAVLSASFAGTSQLASASDKRAFNVISAPTPPPTVTITVSPTSVAAGSPATLTWSTTNATACSAGGAWSGNEPTSGTQNVAPATTGTYMFTLTCTGNGGSANSSAVLLATLVRVTVTAKSGGGAIDGPLCLCLGLLFLLRLRARGAPERIMAMLGITILAAGGAARADESTGTTSAQSSQSPAWSDALYLGVRAGSMPVRLDSSSLDDGLANRGYSGVSATTDTSGIGGTVYVGYELAPHAALELGYTHRDSNVATLSGTVASVANIAPLLQDTTGVIRGYGNIVSLSFRSDFEVAPRILIQPRIGAFFWDTKVTARGAELSFSETHEGGGFTAGIGAAYRVWRGLECGIGIDYFRGSPSNLATLYSGSLEWHFGR
jgi:hypothetical protein